MYFCRQFKGPSAHRVFIWGTIQVAGKTTMSPWPVFTKRMDVLLSDLVNSHMLMDISMMWLNIIYLDIFRSKCATLFKSIRSRLAQNVFWCIFVGSLKVHLHTVCSSGGQSRWLVKQQCLHGLYSLSGWTSYCLISWILEVAIMGVIMILPH